MSMALSFLAPLAAMSLGAPEPVDSPAYSDAELERQSWRFAEVLVNSYSCDLLDYEVDYEGLADWGWQTHELIVAAGASDEEALVRIQRDIRAHRARFNGYHGSVIRLSYRGNAALIGAFSYDQLYRFKKTFGDRCDELANSPDAGAFITAPDERISGQDLVRKLRDMVRTARERLESV